MKGNFGGTVCTDQPHSHTLSSVRVAIMSNRESYIIIITSPWLHLFQCQQKHSTSLFKRSCSPMHGWIKAATKALSGLVPRHPIILAREMRI